MSSVLFSQNLDRQNSYCIQLVHEFAFAYSHKYVIIVTFDIFQTLYIRVSL
ncbi:hypothetical protein Mal48_06900 [Thalassoglobus polymorphus]|uniref:Uncharacterized protein n=1 Tax=Thalassoglobus polymorphus TaxID=2527994 RepID=A0A517QIV3_9PLAN|nr:hypothetical protein Mal48_06900 [Thalassoglobus polymorphus]